MRFGMIFFIVLMICIFETTRLLFLAHARMASHFNFLGNPYGFMPKVKFFVPKCRLSWWRSARVS